MLAEIPTKGNIVQNSYIGNTHILFCDASYANHTLAHHQRVLTQAEQASWNIILRNGHQ